MSKPETEDTYEKVRHSPIVSLAWAAFWFELIWPGEAQECGDCELDKHVKGGDKQGVGEAKVFRREHPFIVEGEYGSKQEPVSQKRIRQQTRRMEVASTTDQDAMKMQLIMAFLHQSRFFAAIDARCTWS